ncbi:MFS transporter [uncultured Pseudokineococcus sp.]|uniref:MFS transporter n=1 Tax=uncultured Pseudokineococcus sp. TaxID=1642928 RepID=UPI0026266612|nr:MFS transporter [uncultured Pseudokineococcus sp.]
MPTEDPLQPTAPALAVPQPLRRRARLRELPPPVRLLLASQLAFNIGFYLVIPFLAQHLTESLLLAGWLVGLVLGLRTASQQGLFFVGGALADRYGTRPVVLAGCLVRVAGLLVLAVADGLPAVVVGTVLTGFAAALFSPAVEAALAHEGRELERRGTTTRTELFALEEVVSRTGSLLGPALGAALLFVPFGTLCVVSAGFFVLVLLATLRWSPRTPPAGGAVAVLTGWRRVLGNRRFLALCLLQSTALLAHNQLYLALPAELERSTGSQAALGWLLVLAASVTIALQVPVARRTRRARPGRVLPLAALVTATAFAVVAGASALEPPSGPAALAPAAALVVLLSLGQVLAAPVVRDLVPRMAQEASVGAHYGVLASVGGLVVLVGSSAVGALLAPAGVSGPAASLPWVLLAGASTTSALGLAVLLRRA